MRVDRQRRELVFVCVVVGGVVALSLATISLVPLLM